MWRVSPSPPRICIAVSRGILSSAARQTSMLKQESQRTPLLTHVVPKTFQWQKRMPQTSFLKHQALQIQNHLQCILKHKMAIWVSSQERFLESIKKGMTENMHLWKEEKKQEEGLKWWPTPKPKDTGNSNKRCKGCKLCYLQHHNTSTSMQALCSKAKKQMARRLQNAFCFLLYH